MANRNSFLIAASILLLAFVFPFTSLCQNLPENKSKDSWIDSAFKTKDVKLKQAFFQEWHTVSQDLEKNFTQKSDPIVIAIQSFFSQIYKPDIDTNRYYFTRASYDSTKKVKKHKIQQEGCFAKAEYFILKPRVVYAISHDSIVRHMHGCEFYDRPKTDFTSLTCYYPDINFGNKKKLYLTDDYSFILSEFILKPMRDNYSLFYVSEERRVFLSPSIEISKSHDGWFYHFETFPVIERVYFNQNINYAVVDFKTSFNTGGYAKFFQKNGAWILDEYQRVSWIQ